MPEILFHYERVNPTSWAYLSSLLTLALFFKFNRLLSVRNVDLFLLISLAPGLLLVQWSWENAGIAENALAIEYLGFIWLFVAGAVLMFRLLIDSAMVRRPLLEPNLNAAGLMFLGGALLFFLMANVVTGKPDVDDISPARQADAVAEEEGSDNGQEENSFSTDGPGFWFLFRLPRIATQNVIGAGPTQGEPTEVKQEKQEIQIREATARVMAILSHVTIVLGMILIGYWHFENATAGIAAAVMYLLLPYTALWTGSVEHALPATLLVWAVLLYRKPLIAGMFIGLALGTVYYPMFLLPLWCSFYWQRGLKRFISGVLIMILVLVVSMAITATSTEQFLDHLVQMFGLRPPLTTQLAGIWKSWSPYYRFPIMAAFLGLSISFAIWPTEKNLGTLLSGTAAIMLGSQFWHAYDGGIYIAWYLPLLLLVIQRPNLEERVATTKLTEGWWIERRKAKAVQS